MKFPNILAMVGFFALSSNAIPDVTAVPRRTDCRSYPGFHYPGESGPWFLFASSPEQEIEYGAASTIGDLDTDGIAYGRMGIAQSKWLAKMPVKCKTLLPSGIDGLVTLDLENVENVEKWVPLSLGPSADRLFLLSNQRAPSSASSSSSLSLQVGAYSHFFAENGTQQVGTFLGWGNVTTWGFLKETNKNGIEQYRIRLLVEGGLPLEEGEFRGFVRAGWWEVDE